MEMDAAPTSIPTNAGPVADSPVAPLGRALPFGSVRAGSVPLPLPLPSPLPDPSPLPVPLPSPSPGVVGNGDVDGRGVVLGPGDVDGRGVVVGPGVGGTPISRSLTVMANANCTISSAE